MGGGRGGGGGFDWGRLGLSGAGSEKGWGSHWSTKKKPLSPRAGKGWGGGEGGGSGVWGGGGPKLTGRQGLTDTD